MSYLTNLFRAGCRGGTWVFLSLMLLLAAMAQAQKPTLPASPTICDYTAPATVSLTAQNVPSGYSTLYLLVNITSGLIVQTSAGSPVFTGVPQGDYYAVAAHYSGTLSNAVSGKLISDVYSSDQCLTYGTALAIRVCPLSSVCDYAIAPASVTFTANSVPGGVTTAYVLVNTATNLIAQVSATTSFSNVPQGDYAITSVHYTGSLTALAPGNTLYGVTTENSNCLSVSNSLYVKVCNNPVVITSPPDGQTIASTNPVVSGTAAPNSSVTVTSANGGTCIATANTNGIWNCPGLTFPAGPNTLTATDGITSATSNFTVVPPVSPPSLLVTGPNGTTVTSPPTVSGTATPGSTIAITDPAGNTVCTTTASASGTFACGPILSLPSGPNTLTVTACNATSCTSQPISFTNVPPTTIVKVGPKVFLGGSYSATAGLMRDNLRTRNLLPSVEPYSSTALVGGSFTHVAGSGGESISSPSVFSVTGADAIVDWVFVELRDPVSASVVIATRSGLLQRDGDVVEVDGTTPLCFTVSPGNYHLAVRHRNHLGVMTASPLALTTTATTVDFTDPLTANFGTHAQRLFTSSNKRALWPGNVNRYIQVGFHTQSTIYQGSGNDVGRILTIINQVLVSALPTSIVPGYYLSDVNMDGDTKYQGSGNDTGLIFSHVGNLHPGNQPAQLPTYIIREQLP